MTDPSGGTLPGFQPPDLHALCPGANATGMRARAARTPRAGWSATASTTPRAWTASAACPPSRTGRGPAALPRPPTSACVSVRGCRGRRTPRTEPGRGGARLLGGPGGAAGGPRPHPPNGSRRPSPPRWRGAWREGWEGPPTCAFVFTAPTAAANESQAGPGPRRCWPRPRSPSCRSPGCPFMSRPACDAASTTRWRRRCRHASPGTRGGVWGGQQDPPPSSPPGVPSCPNSHCPKALAELSREPSGWLRPPRVQLASPGTGPGWPGRCWQGRLHVQALLIAWPLGPLSSWA